MSTVYCIPIIDTHRLPYFNAKITARTSASGSTTPVEFKNYNGESLGFTLYTNARGYLCDSNGNIYTSGVFVPKDAEITATMGDGTTAIWNVSKVVNTAINDGKLIGKSVDGTDDDKVVLHSANTSEDTELNYNNLLGLPKINQWMEVETVCEMTQTEDTLSVNKYAKTITVTTAIASIEDTDNWTLTLTADSTRVAQAIVVRNTTPWRLTLLNGTDGSVIGTVNPFGLLDNSKLIAYYGSTDKKFHCVGDDYQVNSLDKPITISTLSVFQTGIDIDDRTPDLLQIVIDPELSSAMSTLPAYTTGIVLPLNVKCTSRRKIHIWLQNGATAGDIVLTSNGLTVGVAKNYEIGEYLVMGEYDRNYSQAHVLRLANVKPVYPNSLLAVSDNSDIVHVPIGVDYITYTRSGVGGNVTFSFDRMSNGVRRVVVSNGSVGGLVANFTAPATDASTKRSFTVMQGSTQTFLLYIYGDKIAFIDPPNNNELVPYQCTSQGSGDATVYHFGAFPDGGTLRIRPSEWRGICDFGWTGRASDERASGVIELPNFVGTMTFIAHISANVIGPASSVSLKLGMAGTSHSGDDGYKVGIYGSYFVISNGSNFYFANEANLKFTVTSDGNDFTYQVEAVA